MSKQYDSIDLFKCIFSLFVVAIHTNLLSGSLHPLIRLAVPGFFVFSSFFFFSGKSYGKKKILKMVKRNIKLYMSWFVLLLPVTLLIRQYFSRGILFGIITLVKDFIFGSTYLASWYIVALTIALIMVNYIIKRIPKILSIVLVSLIYLVCLATSTYSFLMDYALFDLSKITSIFYPATSFLIGIVWASLTMWLIDCKWFEVKDKFLFLKIIVSVVMLFCEHMLINTMTSNGVDFSSNDCYVFLLPACFYIAKGIINWELHLSNAKELRNISTVIYCLHFSVAVCIRKIITPTFGNINIFMLSIIICLLFYVICNRVRVKCNNHILKSFIGCLW